MRKLYNLKLYVINIKNCEIFIKNTMQKIILIVKKNLNYNMYVMLYVK